MVKIVTHTASLQKITTVLMTATRNVSRIIMGQIVANFASPHISIAAQLMATNCATRITMVKIVIHTVTQQ